MGKEISSGVLLATTDVRAPAQTAIEPQRLLGNKTPVLVEYEQEVDDCSCYSCGTTAHS